MNHFNVSFVPSLTVIMEENKTLLQDTWQQWLLLQNEDSSDWKILTINQSWALWDVSGCQLKYILYIYAAKKMKMKWKQNETQI